MSCYPLKSEDGKINGMLCLCNIFKYPFNGVDYFFEYHHYMGPIPVKKKSLDPRTTIPKGFYKMFDEFKNLSKEKQEEYKIYG